MKRVGGKDASWQPSAVGEGLSLRARPHIPKIANKRPKSLKFPVESAPTFAGQPSAPGIKSS